MPVEEAHDEAFKQFRKDLAAELPSAWRLEVLTSSDSGRGPRMVLGGRRLARWRPAPPKAAT